MSTLLWRIILNQNVFFSKKSRDMKMIKIWAVNIYTCQRVPEEHLKKSQWGISYIYLLKYQHYSKKCLIFRYFWKSKYFFFEKLFRYVRFIVYRWKLADLKAYIVNFSYVKQESRNFVVFVVFNLIFSENYDFFAEKPCCDG